MKGANQQATRHAIKALLIAMGVHLLTKYYMHYPGNIIEQGLFIALNGMHVTSKVVSVGLFQSLLYLSKAAVAGSILLLILLNVKTGGWKKNAKTAVITTTAALVAYFSLYALDFDYILFFAIGLLLALAPGSIKTILNNKTRPRWTPGALEKTLLLGILLVSAAKLHNIPNIDLQEEGMYEESHAIYGAKLISEGLTYLRDFEYLHTPLVLYLFSVPYQFANANIGYFRAYGVIASAITAFLTYKIAERYTSKPTAAVAASILLINPLFFKYSRYANPDILLLLFTSISIYLLHEHYRKGGRVYLVSSSLALSLAYLTKETAIVILLAIQVEMYLRHKSIKPGLEYSVFALAPIAAYYFWLALAGIDWMGYWRVFLDTGAGNTAAEKIQSLAKSFGRDVLLAAMLPFAIIQMNWRKHRILVLWLFSLLTLLAYAYYRPKYTILVLPAAAIMAAGTLHEAAAAIRAKDRLLATLFTAAILAFFIQNIALDARLILQDGSQQINALSKMVEENTAPSEFVLPTQPAIQIMANRRVPPELFEISANRISRGEIPPEAIIRSIEKNKVRLVVVENEKLNTPAITNYLNASGFRKETIPGKLREITVYIKT